MNKEQSTDFIEMCDKYSINWKLIRKCSSMLPHDVINSHFSFMLMPILRSERLECRNWQLKWNKIRYYTIFISKCFHFEIKRTAANVTIHYYILLSEQANSVKFAQFFLLYCSHELTMFAKITGKSGRTKIHVIVDETISPWYATALLAKNTIIIYILPQKDIFF